MKCRFSLYWICFFASLLALMIYILFYKNPYGSLNLKDILSLYFLGFVVFLTTFMYIFPFTTFNETDGFTTIIGEKLSWDEIQSVETVEGRWPLRLKTTWFSTEIKITAISGMHQNYYKLLSQAVEWGTRKNKNIHVDEETKKIIRKYMKKHKEELTRES